MQRLLSKCKTERCSGSETEIDFRESGLALGSRGDQGDAAGEGDAFLLLPRVHQRQHADVGQDARDSENENSPEDAPPPYVSRDPDGREQRRCQESGPANRCRRRKPYLRQAQQESLGGLYRSAGCTSPLWVHSGRVVRRRKTR
jgi:hypothetical protein